MTTEDEAPVSGPLVSVVTTFLNEAAFLRESVESVIAQTYRNWELLLVDDGSTDASSDIARRYAESYPGRIRYLEHEGHRNRGMSASRNHGIRHARGRYLAFLDADDLWLPSKLSEQVAVLERHPEAVMVFGTPVYWRSWTGASEDAGADRVRPLWVERNTLVRPFELLARSYPLAARGGAPCPSDLLLRRDAVERVGGFEEEFAGVYELFEDQAFLAKVYMTSAVFVSDVCWTKYRLHPNQRSGRARVTRDGHYDRVRLYYLRWLKRRLHAAGVRDPTVLWPLRGALRKYDPPLVRWLYEQARRVRRHLRVPTYAR